MTPNLQNRVHILFPVRDDKCGSSYQDQLPTIISLRDTIVCCICTTTSIFDHDGQGHILFLISVYAVINVKILFVIGEKQACVVTKFNVAYFDLQC